MTSRTARLFIYALENPRTGVVRYVGKARDPRKRYQQHVFRARKGEGSLAVGAWINKLAANGLQPALRILEEVTNEDDGFDAEADWIEEHQDTILNATAEHLILAEKWRERNEWHQIYARLSTDARAITVELDRIEQGSRLAREMLRQEEELRSVHLYGWAVPFRRF